MLLLARVYAALHRADFICANLIYFSFWAFIYLHAAPWSVLRDLSPSLRRAAGGKALGALLAPPYPPAPSAPPYSPAPPNPPAPLKTANLRLMNKGWETFTASYSRNIRITIFQSIFQYKILCQDLIAAALCCPHTVKSSGCGFILRTTLTTKGIMDCEFYRNLPTCL